MQITPGQLEKAHKKESSFAKRNKQRNIILSRVYIVCALAFVAGIVLAFFHLISGIITAALGALIFAVIFAMQKSADRQNLLMCYHFLPTADLEEILRLYKDEYCTRNVIDAANELLGKEHDSRRCGVLRKVIALASFAEGDFDGGYRSLFKDDELFEDDKYFALIYYSGVMEYYLSINSTTGGTEYAEQAYRDFCNVFTNSKRLKNNYAAIREAMRCEIIYSFAHGDRAKCIEYIDMLTKRGKHGVSKPDASLLLIKAECLKFMGRSKDAAEIAITISPLLADSPYFSSRIKRLI